MKYCLTGILSVLLIVFLCACNTSLKSTPNNRIADLSPDDRTTVSSTAESGEESLETGESTVFTEYKPKETSSATSGKKPDTADMETKPARPSVTTFAEHTERNTTVPTSASSSVSSETKTKPLDTTSTTAAITTTTAATTTPWDSNDDWSDFF